MKILTNILAAAAFGLGMAMTACQSKDNGDLGHHHHHAEAKAHSHAEEKGHIHGEEADQSGNAGGAEGNGEIMLDPHMAEQFGVKASKAEAGEFRTVVAATGQIIDSPTSTAVATAPTSGIVKFAAGIHQGSKAAAGQTIATISADKMMGGDANAAAKANLEAAKRELDRVTPLHADGIVSTKDYNAAQQAYEVAKAAYSSAAASGKATSPRGGVITALQAQEGQYVNAGDPIATISSSATLTLRADLPEKNYGMLPQLTTANIQLPYSEEWMPLTSLGAKRITAPTTAASQRGYVPVYFDFNNDGSVIPGSFVKVKLLGEARQGVITVPITAVSEQQGAYFVYERLDEDCYRKIPIKTGASDGINIEVTNGLAGGENIVTEGMVAVRLAESSAVAPEGHSHNH
ncbi:MAG: efflux RND transporter periplasmic adaptor subunit [Clostridium sp.]|nr:efflux RND transporter periplasmic adaptor subunit [Clostridium sp.]